MTKPCTTDEMERCLHVGYAEPEQAAHEQTRRSSARRARGERDEEPSREHRSDRWQEAGRSENRASSRSSIARMKAIAKQRVDRAGVASRRSVCSAARRSALYRRMLAVAAVAALGSRPRAVGPTPTL